MNLFSLGKIWSGKSLTQSLKKWIHTLSLISNRLCLHHQETGGIRGNVLVRSMEEHKYRLAVDYLIVFMQNLYLVKCHCGSCSSQVCPCAESSPAELCSQLNQAITIIKTLLSFSFGFEEALTDAVGAFLCFNLVELAIYVQ